jgi:hypothetical protein
VINKTKKKINKLEIKVKRGAKNPRGLSGTKKRKITGNECERKNNNDNNKQAIRSPLGMRGLCDGIQIRKAPIPMLTSTAKFEIREKNNKTPYQKGMTVPCS